MLGEERAVELGPMAELFGERSGACGLEIARVLRIVRRHLGLDVAFISRFDGTHRVLDHLDADTSAPLYRGQRIPLTEGYCLKVVQGELPQLIPDTARHSVARALPDTQAIPIGAHMSVPIVLEDGRTYGTLCCFAHDAKPHLGERDLKVLRAFSEVLALHFGALTQGQQQRDRAAHHLRALMDRGAPRIVFQPVYHIPDRRLHGFECLSRFDTEPLRSPDQWFALAHDAGLGLELELHAIHKALDALPLFPPGPCININCSPQMILSGQLLALRERGDDLSRVVLEITEHAIVGDYGALADALAPLRACGLVLAVDDAGAGYASMRHILSLEPDIIKLDMALTRGIHADGKRRALAKGLSSFAHEIGSVVVAEGVETTAELETLVEIGVDCAQGYLFARPLDLPQALACCAVR
jgi:EAL domain-containing protein (putative c-di-GMP-specific phosphodiesterase class I)